MPISPAVATARVQVRARGKHRPDDRARVRDRRRPKVLPTASFPVVTARHPGSRVGASSVPHADRSRLTLTPNLAS